MTDEPGTGFDAYRSHGRRRGYGLCSRCGNQSGGQIQVRMLERVDGKSRQLASRAWSFCESCTIDLYEQLVSTMDGNTHD